MEGSVCASFLFMTEEQIVYGTLQKNPAAQEALYQMFSPKMLGVCYRYAQSREDAEDMLQEGFIIVFRMLSQFRREGSLEGWIRKIMVHSCINILKKNKKFSDTLELANAENLMTLHDHVPSILQAKQIVECIRLLPVGYRTVINLYAIEGYSHKEISELLEIAEVTSRSQYLRGKAVLMDILVKRGICHPSQFGKNGTKTSSIV